MSELWSDNPELQAIIEQEIAKLKERSQEPELGGMSWLWKKILGFFEAQSQKIWSGFTGIFWSVTATIFEKVGSWFSKQEQEMWNSLIVPLSKAGWIDEDTEKDLHSLIKVSFPFNILVFAVVCLSFIVTYIKNMIVVTSADLRRKMFSKYESEDAPAQSILPAAFIAPEKTTEIFQILHNQGFSAEQIELMLLAMYRTYDEGTIRNLYLRGILSEEKLYERMRELGYTDTRIKEMVQGWPVIPNVTDLFHLVAKEAFEPDMIKHYGYADEFPEDQIKWLAMQGVSREWALKFWYAHWDTPSIQHGFEMLHRQDPDNPDKKIIDYKELDDLFRTVEIPPFWRDKLTKIAFMPYTRVDVRRMHKMGVLTDEQLQVAYEDLGFDPEHALNMVNFTKKFNTEKDKDLTRSEILKGYSEGLITLEDTSQLLINMGYSKDESEYITTYENYKKDKKLQDMILKNLQSRYESNLISENETRERLAKLNLSGSHIDLLMDEWKINIFQDMKMPSKADLTNFVMNDVISTDQYYDEMFKLGYKQEYIDWYVQLDMIKAKEKKK